MIYRSDLSAFALVHRFQRDADAHRALRFGRRDLYGKMAQSVLKLHRNRKIPDANQVCNIL